jgi:hypothetical protein
MQELRSALLISFLSSLSLAAGLTGAAAPGAGRAKSEPTYQRPDKKLLDQMIGDWDVDYAIYDEHGGVRHYLGTASFRWILDDKAIQEIWTSDYRGRKTQPYGTTLEFYDAKRQSWTAVWIYPEQSMYFSVGGGEVDGRIVLTGNDQEGVLQRWSNQDFRSDSFVGRFEVSKDGGKTWRLVGVNHMQRHKAG